MAFTISSLWKAPEINPVNRKARSIPILNPINVYGRVFFFSWFGFFISFWSWYAFPPLTTITIKHDLHLSQTDIANGNILAMAASVAIRATAGFACDRFGPRKTFIVILLCGALPTALAGTITNAAGLLTIRCFAGILGASFVPCEVWASAFFDKNVVGAANAIAAGWGNAGGGITYFVMPVIYNSFVKHRGLSEHVAWRLTFIVPFILIAVTAGLMMAVCPDSPMGPWSARHRALNHQLTTRDMFVSTAKNGQSSGLRSNSISDDKIELRQASRNTNEADPDADAEDPIIAEQDLLAAASWELVQRPTVAQTTHAVFSIHSLALFLLYFASLGSELAVMSILGAYYYRMFPWLGQTDSGNWASMFGLLNFVVRPLSGIVSDAIYRPSGSLWARKIWIHAVGFMAGAFGCIIGWTEPRSTSGLFSLMAGLAIFVEATNGAVFGLVPHVFPASNGVISGLTGASGSLGGVIFTLIARHTGVNYPRLLWIIGLWTLVTNVITCWVPPISKRQLGGR